MKTILIPIACLLLSACGNKTKEQETVAAPQDSILTETIISEEDSTSADGLTAATSHTPNTFFNGVIMISPQNEATVTLIMGGTVHSTTLLPGNYVHKGTLLAAIENPDFISLQQTYLDAAAQTEYLKAEYERQQRLSQEEAASQKRFQQSKADYLSMKSKMEASAAQLSLLGVHAAELTKTGIQPLLQVKAPISGYISTMNINLGKYIESGSSICNIIDKADPMIRLTAYEKDLPNLKLGQSVQFSVNGMGDEEFKATIISIGQEIDANNRSLNVYARIKSADSRFRPGMYVAASIEK